MTNVKAEPNHLIIILSSSTAIFDEIVSELGMIGGKVIHSAFVYNGLPMVIHRTNYTIESIQGICGNVTFVLDDDVPIGLECVIRDTYGPSLEIHRWSELK